MTAADALFAEAERRALTLYSPSAGSQKWSDAIAFTALAIYAATTGYAYTGRRRTIYAIGQRNTYFVYLRRADDYLMLPPGI